MQVLFYVKSYLSKIKQEGFLGGGLPELKIILKLAKLQLYQNGTGGGTVGAFEGKRLGAKEVDALLHGI